LSYFPLFGLKSSKKAQLFYNISKIIEECSFMAKQIIQVEERPPFFKALPLSVQHLFAMFSASVLVPILLGISPSVVLFMNGIGTLLYILVTKGKAPAFLGSSFAFIAPAGIIIGTKGLGYPYALGGFVVSGAVFCVVAVIIHFCGTKWIDVILPPAAMGSVVALIGLELAGTAANMGGLILSDTYTQIDPKKVTVFLITLAVAVFGSVLFRKFLAVIPILIAIIVGYFAAWAMGMIDFSAVAAAPVFAVPNFQLAKFDWNAISIILPATLVVVSEHIGHQIVTGKIIGRDILRNPGLHRTMLGDGLSTMVSGLCGSVPTTTYGENIGVMAMTGVYSVWVIGGAAVLSILVSFLGKVAAVIQSIPDPVMGGVSFLLYGMIASSGVRLLVDQKVDYSRSRNLAMTSVVLVTGLSGAFIQIGQVKLTGMSLGAVVAMLLGLIFWIIDHFHAANDYEETAVETTE
jgi:uracil permease